MIEDRSVLRKTSAPSWHDEITSSMKSSRGEASQLFCFHFHLGFWGVHWWLMRKNAVTMRSQASCSRCWWISILPAIFLMSCLSLKSSHNQRLASEKGAVLWLIWEVVDSLLIEPLDLQNWARKGAFLRLGITRCYVPYHSLIYYKQSSIEMDDIKN